MIVKIIKVLYDSDYNGDFLSYKKGDIENIKYEIEKYCCDKMEEAINEYFIFFGEYDSCGLNKDKNMNIGKCSPYPEGAVFYEMAISYCPFCGNKIEYV